MSKLEMKELQKNIMLYIGVQSCQMKKSSSF